MNHVITIDGPAASGKSTVSRLLSERLSWEWVSTGAFYRTVGYLAHHHKIDVSDEDQVVELVEEKNWEIKMAPKKTHVFYEGKDISDEIFIEEVGTFASQVSSHPKVRAALLQAQRDLTEKGNLIAEGRDCGTVVFPQAFLKIYLTADQAQRASRRVQQGGGEVDEVLKAQKLRDKQDSQRKSAPLQAAKDAVVIDTTELTLEQVVDHVEGLVQQRLQKKAEF